MFNFDYSSINNADKTTQPFDFWTLSLNNYPGGVPTYIHEMTTGIYPFYFNSSTIKMLDYKIYGKSVHEPKLWDRYKPIFTNDDDYPMIDEQGRKAVEDVGEDGTQQSVYGYYDEIKNIFTPVEGMSGNLIQKIDYLASTGTQRINVGLTGNLRWEIECQADEASESVQIVVSSSQSGVDGTFLGVSDKWLLGEDFITEIGADEKINANITFDASGASGTINGESVSGLTPSTQNQWALFATSTQQHPFIGKVWNAKAYNTSDELVRSYIPVKIMGIGGFLDTVEWKMYGSVGAGAFNIGSEITDPNPSEIIKIESVGKLVEAGEHEGKYRIGIKAFGKNLFNKDNVTNGYYINSQGELVEDEKSCYSDLIRVRTDSFTLSGLATEDAGDKSIHAYDKYGNWLAQIDVQGTVPADADYSITFTNNDDYYFVRLSIYKSDTNVQFECEATATEYEEFKQATTEIYLDEPLRKISSSFIDNIDFLNKKVVRKIKSMELTGGIRWSSQTISDKTFYALSKEEIGTSDDVLPMMSTNIICSGFKAVNIAETPIPVGSVCVNANQLLFNFDDVNDDLDYFKIWLNSNPVELCFPLAEETEEEIHLPAINILKGYNYFVIDSEPSSIYLKFRNYEQ